MNASFQFKVILCAIAGAVLAVVVGGFFLVGSPSYARLVKFDNARAQDLDRIANEITHLYLNKKILSPPQSLEELARVSYDPNMPAHDPETNTPYEYRVIDENSYELCARFAASNENAGERDQNFYYGKRWQHAPGRVCFELQVNQYNGLNNRPIRIP